MPLLETYERITERTYTLDPAPIPTCTPADPFGVDHDCVNPCGHHYERVERSVVACLNCGRIPWP